MTDIYIVYLTYFSTVEQIYSFKSLESAETKQLELSHKWVNTDTWDTFLSNQNVSIVTLDTFCDYFMEVEDDCYVGIDKVILND